MNITKESEEMPNQATEYQNRYGDVFTFELQENGDVIWGFPLYILPLRTGDDFIDPSGGPYIKKGQMLSHVIGDIDFNVIVDGFEKISYGYIIKTIPHEYDPNDTSHLADTKIIGGIINTTDK